MGTPRSGGTARAPFECSASRTGSSTWHVERARDDRRDRRVDRRRRLHALRSLRAVDGGDHHSRGPRGTSRKVGRKRGAPRDGRGGVRVGLRRDPWSRWLAARRSMEGRLGPPHRHRRAVPGARDDRGAGPGAAAPPAGPTVVADVLLRSGRSLPVRGGVGRRVPHLSRPRDVGGRGGGRGELGRAARGSGTRRTVRAGPRPVGSGGGPGPTTPGGLGVGVAARLPTSDVPVAPLAAAALGAAFSWSVGAKIARPASWRRVLGAHGLPRWVQRASLIGVPVAEVATVGLVVMGMHRTAGFVALVILAAFSAAILPARRRFGDVVTCGCFGTSVARDYRILLLRNALLVGGAAIAAFGGVDAPRISVPGLPSAGDALPAALAVTGIAVAAWMLASSLRSFRVRRIA